MQDVERGAVVEDEVDLGIEDAILVEEVEVEVLEMLDLIPWRATSVGCVVIWPVTVPLLLARQ